MGLGISLEEVSLQLDKEDEARKVREIERRKAVQRGLDAITAAERRMLDASVMGDVTDVQFSSEELAALAAGPGLVELDPHGKDPHQPGAKKDAGKPRPWLVLAGFNSALNKVIDVASAGAEEYTDGGWVDVPNGVERYMDACMRHVLAYGQGETLDKKTGLPHLSHAAWNLLAVQELLDRGRS